MNYLITLIVANKVNQSEICLTLNSNFNKKRPFDLEIE